MRFPVNFVEFLRIAFYTEHLWQLPLQVKTSIHNKAKGRNSGNMQQICKKFSIQFAIKQPSLHQIFKTKAVQQ